MEIFIRNRNLLYQLGQYVSLKDIYNIGGVCKVTRNAIRKNTNLWKDLVCKIYPSELWTEMNLDDEDYLIIAINSESIETQFKKLYCLYRLKQPVSTPKGLGLYCEIITDGLPTPHQKLIFLGELVEGNKVKFGRKSGCFFLFNGEMDCWSSIKCYLIDRKVKSRGDPKNYNLMEALKLFQKRITIMTIPQREEIEKILKPLESENELLTRLTRFKKCRIDTCLEITYTIDFDLLFKLLNR